MKRGHGSVAGRLHVVIRFHGFETHTRSRTLATPTSADQEIFRQAWELYRAEHWEDRAVRLIGLGIGGWESDLSPAMNQGDLFDEMESENDSKQARLYETLDAVSEKFGRKSVRLGIRRRKE